MIFKREKDLEYGENNDPNIDEISDFIKFSLNKLIFIPVYTDGSAPLRSKKLIFEVQYFLKEETNFLKTTYKRSEEVSVLSRQGKIQEKGINE